MAAVAAAHDLPQLSLLDALDLTMLVARKDPARQSARSGPLAVAHLEEQPEATIEEAALAASCLIALPGARFREAAQTLKAMGRNGHQPRTGKRPSVSLGPPNGGSLLRALSASSVQD